MEVQPQPFFRRGPEGISTGAALGLPQSSLRFHKKGTKPLKKSWAGGEDLHFSVSTQCVTLTLCAVSPLPCPQDRGCLQRSKLPWGALSPRAGTEQVRFPWGHAQPAEGWRGWGWQLLLRQPWLQSHQGGMRAVPRPRAASSFPALSQSTEEISCPFSLSFRKLSHFHLLEPTVGSPSSARACAGDGTGLLGQQHPSPLLGEGVMEDNSCGTGKLQDLKIATCVLSKETDDCWRCAMLGCNLAHVLAINPAPFLTNLLEIVIAPALQGLVLC